MTLTFSAAMSTGTIDNAGNYQVAWESIQKVRSRVKVGNRFRTVVTQVPVFHPVPIAFQPNGSSAITVVLATTMPMKKFAKGGQVVVVSPGSILSAAGVALGGSTTISI